MKYLFVGLEIVKLRDKFQWVPLHISQEGWMGKGEGERGEGGGKREPRGNFFVELHGWVLSNLSLSMLPSHG